MAYAFVQTLHGMEDDDYAAIRAAIDEALGGTPPAGLVLHVAGPVPGGYRYLDLWESEAAWQRFHDDVVHPALARAGILGPGAKPIRVEAEPLDGVVDTWGSAVPARSLAA